MAPRIIAENEWLVALDKPVGLIAHSDGRTEEHTVAEWLGEHYPALQGVAGAWNSPPGREHRIERPRASLGPDDLGGHPRGEDG